MDRAVLRPLFRSTEPNLRSSLQIPYERVESSSLILVETAKSSNSAQAATVRGTALHMTGSPKILRTASETHGCRDEENLPLTSRCVEAVAQGQPLRVE